MQTRATAERIYNLITGEEDGRLCREISDTACTDLPQNFLLNASNGALTKLAEQIASPGLVLAWILAAIGAPTLLTGFLVPVRQAGSLLPQMAVAARIRALKKRKWAWVFAGLVQTVALLVMIPAAAYLEPLVAGILILALLAVFSIASGIGSVAFNDVMGKTISKYRRGQLLAVRTAAGGFLAVVAGLVIRYYVRADSEITPYLLLLGAAATLWFLASLVFAAISEEDGATEGGRNALTEVRDGLVALKNDIGLRRFVYARALLVTVELALPFYALYLRGLAGDDLQNLGIFIVAASLAGVISSPLWGRFADRSSRTVMAMGGGVAILTGIYALVLGVLPASWHNPYLLGVTFLLAGLAIAGVRLGRKTYLVDYAPKEQRPLYVALSNTIVGAITIIGGLLGAVAGLLGLEVTIVLLIIFAASGAIVCHALPETAGP